jgi:hypothetical protein
MIEALNDFLFPAARLDWFGAGPSSPNKTGTLLALLFIVSWWPALRFRRGFWFSLPLAFVCGIFLLQTKSRGGMMALFCGMGMMLLFRSGRFGLQSRPCVREVKTVEQRADRQLSIYLRLAIGIVVIALLFAYSLKVGAGQRFAHMASGHDGSANVRVALYSAGLRMIADAPQGWGRGTAAETYRQWYQTPGDERTYLSLVNSHLTWMSEYGIGFRLAYMAAWVLILMLCFPVPYTPLRATAICCWIALGVGAAFSSVLTFFWLWLIPVVLLLLCIVQRFRDGEWPSKQQWRWLAIAVCVLFFGLLGMARIVPGKPEISFEACRLSVGNGSNRLLLLEPDPLVLGERLGHTIREDLPVDTSLELRTESSLNDVTLSDYSCIILNGTLPETTFNGYPGRVVLLNPNLTSDSRMLNELADCRLRIVIGEMGDWRRLHIWKQQAARHSDWELIVLPGVAEYIPDWMNYCKEGDA